MLVHLETGLLLQHAWDSEASVRDGDMVAGMLSRICEFVASSFRGDASGSLESMSVGDLTVCVETGPLALLAAVVRGKVPPEFRGGLQDTLLKIHLDLSSELQHFSGDTAPFESSAALLKECLEKEQPGRIGAWSRRRFA
jgi:OOP family OmpA-OmpF porin